MIISNIIIVIKPISVPHEYATKRLVTLLYIPNIKVQKYPTLKSNIATA